MKSAIDNALTISIGLVWVINGLFCKVLGFTPRHESIVEKILGPENAREITVLIGLGEIALAVWFWSGILRRSNAFLQMLLVATMNVLEFLIAPELLLWERWNIVWAFLFIAIVGVHEFVFRPKPTPTERP